MARRRSPLVLVLPALLAACAASGAPSVPPASEPSAPPATATAASSRAPAPTATVVPASPVASAGEDPGRVDPERAPTDGVVALAAGFTPDPYEHRVTSGGGVDLAGLGDDCRGWAEAAPDLVIEYEAGSMSLLRVYLVADDDAADTTLAVHGPDGTWRCNDDASSAGFDPMVDVPAPPSGSYAVWVGSFEADVAAAGTLHVTELSVNRP